MKKTAIIAIALLTLITAIATGTFANYTVTKAGTVALTGYEYEADVAGKSTGDLDIAPGQTKSGTFTVENTASGSIKVSEISVVSDNNNLTVVTEPAPTGNTIAANGSEDYTFEVKLADDANGDATYNVTVTVTVVDDLGSESTIDMTAVTFE